MFSFVFYLCLSNTYGISNKTYDSKNVKNPTKAKIFSSARILKITKANRIIKKTLAHPVTNPSITDRQVMNEEQGA